MNKKLTVCLTPAENRKEQFLLLFESYIEELSRYGGRPVPNNYAENLFCSGSVFFVEVNGETAGFVAAARSDKTDYLIEELFIRPAFRCHGAAEATLNELYSRCPGTYSLHINTRNRAARCFWKRHLIKRSDSFVFKRRGGTIAAVYKISEP